MSRPGFGWRLALLAAGLLLGAHPGRAQLAPDSARLVVKGAVAALFSRTYEVEAEYRWAKQLSCTLAPQLLAGQVLRTASPTGSAAGDRVGGYGGSAGVRFYVPNTGGEDAKLAGLYFGLQASYQQLRLRFKRETWGEDETADGLRYYVFRPRDFSETIVRQGGAAVLGYQCQVFHPRLRLDASAHLHRLASRSDAGAASRYRSSSADYAYSGTLWTLGLGLGFVVK